MSHTSVKIMDKLEQERGESEPDPFWDGALLETALIRPRKTRCQIGGSLTLGQDKEIKSKARNQEFMAPIERGTRQTSIQYWSYFVSEHNF